MKVRATFDLPLDDEETRRIIEKAREIGLPLLTVVIQVDDQEVTDELVRGATREHIEGYLLGQRVGELRDELSTIGTGARFLGWQPIPEDAFEALAFPAL